MGIHLDWQVESDGGHEAVEEDAQVVAAQKQRSRRWRNVLIGIAVIGMVVGSIAWYRAKIVRDEKMRVLVATVEAEATALRIGDKDKFMRLQGPDEDWRDQQREMFDQMQAFGVSIDVTGHILSQIITDQEAEITVEIVVNGMPSQAVWLYQYTEKGWKHVDTRDQPWEDTTAERYPFTYEYNTAHQPQIDQLDAMLHEWSEIASAETGMTDLMEITIQIEDDPELKNVRWSSKQDGTLRIPQHLLAAADLSAPDDDLRIDLARRFAARWADHFSHDIPSRDYELETELSLWLQDKFGIVQREPYRPSVFTKLSAYFGPEVFSDFMRTYREVGSYDMAFQQIIFPEVPANPDAAYFERFLNSYASLNSDPMNPSIALESLFVTYGDGVPMRAIVYSGSVISGAQPGTIHVEEFEQFQEVLWVRASFTYDTNWWQQGGEPLLIERSALIPFRKVGEMWKLTAVYPEDWGQILMEQSDLVTFYYPEIDKDVYQGRVQYLEELYRLSAEQLGLAEIAPIEVTVRTDFMFEDEEWGTISPKVYPYRLDCCYDQNATTDEAIRASFAWAVYSELFDYVAGPAQPSMDQPYMLESALVQWAIEKNGWGWTYYEVKSEVFPDVAVPDSFADLLVGIAGYSDSRSEYEYRLRSMGVYTMVQMVIETYGEEAYVPLVQHVRSIESVEDWLRLSLNLDEDGIRQLEALWRDRYHAEVRELFGDGAFE